MSFSPKEYIRMWRAKNPERAKALQKKSYEKNKEKRIAAQKAYNKAHATECKAYQAAWQARYKKTPINRFSNSQYNISARGKSWDIDFDSYAKLISQPCVYCGCANEGTGSGLDRIDNTKDYVLDNVQSCCGPCNSIRGQHLTVEEMKVAMQAVLNFRAGAR